LNGNVLIMTTDQSVSSFGSEANGISIAFSSSCPFTTGQTIPLTDPCIWVAGGVVGDPNMGEPSSTFMGVQNTCFPDYGAAYGPTHLAPVCGGYELADSQGTLTAQSASFTTGGLTLNQWSDTPGNTVSVTISGTLTATNSGSTMATLTTLYYSSAAVSGTASAAVVFY
jgi:hypothetical protein